MSEVHPEWLRHFHFECNNMGPYVYCVASPECPFTESLDFATARDLYGMIRAHWHTEHAGKVKL